jgi:transposase InsO family protein
LIISMDDSEAVSLEQIRAFLAGSGEVRFVGVRRGEVYAWVERTLVRHQYAGLGRADKGVVRQYLARMTGRSRAQVTRLIAAHRKTGRVKAAEYRRTKFATRYTAGDVTLLAYVDQAHGNLSGPATKRILEREYFDYGQAAYARLAGISVAQIYRFRNSAAYRKRNTTYQPTRPTVIRIGERRKPRPHGSPGYLRIDTVHQGDCDGVKGIYHINAVDEVTQWEIVAATPQISELWLIPLLETMLQQFPFVIRGFHSDNGSEFINYTVAELLGKLLIEQTKSRARHSGDNGLVEAKNGAVIRKHLGFVHIGAEHAQAVDAFHRDHLNPYVNFHRPCAVPVVVVAANGKRRRLYPRWATPWELLQEIPRCQSLLRPGVTLAELHQFAQLQSDTEAALDMQRAKRQLLSRVGKRSA